MEEEEDDSNYQNVPSIYDFVDVCDIRSRSRSHSSSAPGPSRTTGQTSPSTRRAMLPLSLDDDDDDKRYVEEDEEDAVVVRIDRDMRRKWQKWLVDRGDSMDGGDSMYGT